MIVTFDDAQQNTKTAQYWKQDRLIMLFEVDTRGSNICKFWSNKQGSASAPIASYKADNSELCYIDVTDYVRTNGNCTLYVQCAMDGGTITCSLAVTIAGLINPAGVFIPNTKLTSYGALVIPPFMYYAGYDYEECEAEFYALSNTGTWNVTDNASMGVGGRLIGQMCGDYNITRNNVALLKYKMRAFQCGVEYIKVKWVSFTGITREHWFEVEKHKTETAGAYSLLTINGDYKDIKGRVDGFTLRLDRLNAYDLWYYSDILHSSNVQVSRDGGDTDAWRRVQIADKAITLPDGEAGTNGVLEIAVNYRNYDAVTM